MEYQVEYTDDRQARIAEQEALGRQMIHDDFLPTGNVMTFIDPLPSPPSIPERDLAAETEALELRLDEVERRLDDLK